MVTFDERSRLVDFDYAIRDVELWGAGQDEVPRVAATVARFKEVYAPDEVRDARDLRMLDFAGRNSKSKHFVSTALLELVPMWVADILRELRKEHILSSTERLLKQMAGQGPDQKARVLGMIEQTAKESDSLVAWHLMQLAKRVERSTH